MKGFFISLFSIILFSCGPNQQATTGKRKVENKFAVEGQENNILQIRYSDGSRGEITLKGEAFEYLISPDSQKIAVNTSLFSNLQITEVYRLNDSGKIDQEKVLNISTIVWDSISTKYDTDKASVLYPRASAIGWKNSSTINVLVTGSTETGTKIKEELGIIVVD